MRFVRGRMLLSLLSILAVVLAACAEQSAEETGGEGDPSATEVTGPVQTLLIYPETGPLAPIAATPVRVGTDAAVQLWNEEHPDRPIELTRCNSEGNPERAIACVQRYGSDSDIIVGPHFSTEFLAAEEIIDENSLVTTSTPHALPDPASNIFQTQPTAEDAIEAAIPYMKERGWNTFGLITSTDSTGNSAHKAGLSVAEELDMTVAAESFDPESEDLSGQVSSVAAKDPDVVFIWSSGAQVVTALRAMQTVGLDVPVFLNFASMSRGLMELAADVLPRELLFTGTSAFTPDLVKNEEWRRRIEEFSRKYEEQAGTPPDYIAFTVADSVWVAANAALYGEAPEDMTAWLEQEEAVTAINAEYDYSADDHIGLEGKQPIVILQWTGGGWEPA